MAVFGYVRVSTAEQAADDRSSLETQRRKILAAAELAGLKVDEIIEEPGVSGTGRWPAAPRVARCWPGWAPATALSWRSWTALSAMPPMPWPRPSS